MGCRPSRGWTCCMSVLQTFCIPSLQKFWGNVSSTASCSWCRTLIIACFGSLQLGKNAQLQAADKLFFQEHQACGYLEVAAQSGQGWLQLSLKCTINSECPQNRKHEASEVVRSGAKKHVSAKTLEVHYPKQRCEVIMLLFWLLCGEVCF